MVESVLGVSLAAAARMTVKRGIHKIFPTPLAGRIMFRITLVWLGFRSVIGRNSSERLVEYSFCLEHLSPIRGSRILDVGCVLSYLSYELAYRGAEVYGVDVRENTEGPPTMKFHRGDVRLLPFANEFFDAIVAISTLEHVGLGFYGDTASDGGDITAVRELSRVLRKGGKMVITLPFGSRYSVDREERKYDELRLRSLSHGLVIEEKNHYTLRNGKWHREIPSGHGRAVVCLSLRK